MRMWIRVGAGAGLLLLLVWLISTGYWEIALLVIVGAALGAVMARPRKPPAYKPTYWVRKDLGL